MHRANHLRTAFEEWVEDGQPSGANAEQILGQLWNCTDIVPGMLCTLLEVPVGSTYAAVAQRLARQ